MRVTLLGRVLITVVIAALGIAQFGPQSAQGPAFAAAAVILLLLLAGGLSGGFAGSSTKDIAARRDEFHAGQRDTPETFDAAQREEEQWARERERYRQKEQGGDRADRQR